MLSAAQSNENTPSLTQAGNPAAIMPAGPVRQKCAHHSNSQIRVAVGKTAEPEGNYGDGMEFENHLAPTTFCEQMPYARPPPGGSTLSGVFVVSTTVKYYNA